MSCHSINEALSILVPDHFAAFRRSINHLAAPDYELWVALASELDLQQTIHHSIHDQPLISEPLSDCTGITMWIATGDDCQKPKSCKAQNPKRSVSQKPNLKIRMRASRDIIKHDRKDGLASHYFSSSRLFHLRSQNKNTAIMHSAQDTLANASERQLPTARLGHNGPLVTRLGYGLMGLVSVIHRLFSMRSDH